MTLIGRAPYAAATLGGGSVGTILSARCSFGFDLRVSEAYITVPTRPAIGTYLDQVQLVLGATQTSSQVRFRGLLLEYDYDLFPGAVTLVCRGNLWRAATYENPTLGGTDLADAGGGSRGQTDQVMVRQVLNAVPGLTYSTGAIGGTGKVLGTIAVPDVDGWGNRTSPFVWTGPSTIGTAYAPGAGPGVGETALSFIERLDSISEGYRLFETAGGTLYRFQIYGRPRAASDFTFTQGLDIFQGRSTRSILETRNRAVVTGYDIGSGIPNFVSIVEASGTLYPSTESHTIAFASPQIEKANESDGTAGVGQSCQAVCNYLLSEYNREIVKLQLTTPRDDFIGPGQTHSILSPRLGTTEPLWVQHVDVELGADGVFSQTISYIGGGTTLSYAPPPVS